MFKHILCPTVMGNRAYFALKKAVQIAHQFDARITLLNIHKEFMNKEERKMLRVSADEMKEKFKQIALESKKEMHAIIHELHADDVELDFMLREGSPETEIVKVANDLDVDLIVICTDGRDNIKDFVAGTITERVINNAGCPVLVIPFKKQV